ncbi:SURF1 family protein [Variovorax sp. HJSM1_2]|uniref:SURF1 family protein n=1 Tax=Variovorax sp. HJSM1_2 TaxID=3366263 RepID=UPI003BEBF860
MVKATPPAAAAAGSEAEKGALSRAPRAPWVRIVLALLALALFAGFMSLGLWQVQRRAWKLDLIERVDRRVHAAAVPAPAVAQWPTLSVANDEYRHVRLQGMFLYEREALVQAVTELGSGFWVITPMQLADGSTVLVNRGFVPPSARARAARQVPEVAGLVTLNGLLRFTEPGGGFLRHNDAAADLWYSRDVAAIGAARQLQNLAPYFVDADADSAAPRGLAVPQWPVAGLTVISFKNNHLIYALTWFGLALMVVGATVLVVRHERRQRGSPAPTPAR